MDEASLVSVLYPDSSASQNIIATNQIKMKHVPYAKMGRYSVINGFDFGIFRPSTQGNTEVRRMRNFEEVGYTFAIDQVAEDPIPRNKFKATPDNLQKNAGRNAWRGRL